MRREAPGRAVVNSLHNPLMSHFPLLFSYVLLERELFFLMLFDSFYFLFYRFGTAYGIGFFLGLIIILTNIIIIIVLEGFVLTSQCFLFVSCFATHLNMTSLIDSCDFTE